MEYTNMNVKGQLDGSFVGSLKGVQLSKTANYTLSEDEKLAYIGITLSAASKTVTLGLPDGAFCFVANEGNTNAFTLKNVAGDTGTSVAAGKIYAFFASATADGSKAILLN